MALPADGQPISLSQVQSEFGGAHPISMSEYYLSGSYVTSNNTDVPDGSASETAIGLGDFHDTVGTVVVDFEIIGGGGAGGYGLDDGAGGGHVAEGGYTTRVYQTGTFDYSATGGAGGQSGVHHPDTGATAGGSSYYGSGGHANSTSSNQGNAPASSYGAGGGGGKGDHPAYIGIAPFRVVVDPTGWAGDGGSASTRATYSLQLVPGSSVNVLVGRKGVATHQHRWGGDGAGGYVKFTRGNNVTEYTNTSETDNQASFTYIVPSS